MNSIEYYNWLKKFEKRSTSDDTFTPPAVYDVVYDYVDKHIIGLDGLNVVRPFYPDGDYTDLSQYGDNSIVIDNPPFSIMTKICEFYQVHGIKFFIFSPALTTFQSSRKAQGLTHIITNAYIVYDNGARVKTSFIHNLTPHIKVKTAPSLHKALTAIYADKPSLPKYNYPANVMMVSHLQKLCDVDYEIAADECVFISRLDSQKAQGKQLFGGGFLISENKAKELQTKELHIKAKEGMVISWELSKRERQIIMTLGA